MQEKRQTAGTDKKGWGRRHSPVMVAGEGEWVGASGHLEQERNVQSHHPQS